MYLKLKPFLIGLTVIALFTGCMHKSDDQEQLINDHFKYLNTHNLAALRNQYTENADIAGTDLPGVKHGPVGADEEFHYTFLVSPLEQYLVKNIIHADSATIVEYEVRGMKPNMGPRGYYIYKGCTIFKIKDGKITSDITYTNGSMYPGSENPWYH
jgi:hypothetical protein